jgi:hypothetical protein
MEIKKIISQAKKIQFGRSRQERIDRSYYLDGVIFACKRMENGEQILKDLGYNVEEIS